MLSAGRARCVVTGVGAGIRELTIDGEPVLLGYGSEELCAAGRGQVLAPWPNRLEDGTYELDGRRGTAALDEPERHNAIHGLARWVEWRPVERWETSVTLLHELAAQPGYPWRIAVELTYELASEGELRVRCRAWNRAYGAAPFGVGFHPYVAAGPGGADACTLQLVAVRHLVTNDRALPIASDDVPGSPLDFAAPRSLAGTRLDDCFTDLRAAPDGSTPEGAAWSATVTRGDGRRVTVAASADLPYAMVFTADTLPPEERRTGIAVEPMSCAPNAFRDGASAGLVTLPQALPDGAPSEVWSAEWSVITDGW